MSREELREFWDEYFCGCGNPPIAAAALLNILQLHPLFEGDNSKRFERLVRDAGVQYLVLYNLDSMGLTEHGGSVGGGWLSEQGEIVRDALQREAEDGFKGLFYDNT